MRVDGGEVAVGVLIEHRWHGRIWSHYRSRCPLELSVSHRQTHMNFEDPILHYSSPDSAFRSVYYWRCRHEVAWILLSP